MCHAEMYVDTDVLQEYQFRGIQKSEWNNLFNFIQAKRLRIENVAEAEMGPSGAARPALDVDLGEDIDTGSTFICQQKPCVHLIPWLRPLRC